MPVLQWKSEGTGGPHDSGSSTTCEILMRNWIMVALLGAMSGLMLSPDVRADSARSKQRWVISVEGTGRSFYGSINVDRSLDERWSVGGGYGSAWTVPTLSAYANAYLAGEYLAVYLTGGVSGYFFSGYSQWF
ncbi:MAG: hypothetical protein EBZ87_02320, partial [Microbacteriaceae bacterium]|nr:hypothetical protein [Microbacteriaceae bacterium]